MRRLEKASKAKVVVFKGWSRTGKYFVSGGLPPRGTGLATGRAGERHAGQPRSDWERFLQHFGVEPQSNNPWDWASFGWGLLGGALATAAVGGVALYFGWPYLVAALKTVPEFKRMVEEAKRAGLL